MTTPKRSRFRRILEWAGAGVCLLILAAWTASTQSIFEYLNTDGNVFISFSLYSGRLAATYIVYDYADSKTVRNFDSPALWRRRRITRNGSWKERIGLHLPQVRRGDGFMGMCNPTPSKETTLRFPLWIPFAAIAMPTGFLFLRDRRRIPPGHCQTCGYNLTANTSGICPECGKPCESNASAT